MAGRQIPDRDEAISALFYACYPKLVRTGYSLAGDWAVAEEMAQEAFVRLWHKWRWIRDPETAPAYLYRTVVNLGNSAIRRRALERRVASFRTEQPVSPDPVADLDLRQAIAALTPRKRACVVLREQRPVVPPHVDYSLTDRGRELAALLLPLMEWIIAAAPAPASTPDAQLPRGEFLGGRRRQVSVARQPFGRASHP